MTASQMNSASYDVGYGKPPRRTQFKAGQSGNPGGRPRGRPAERLKELALHEAYRTVIVKEDGHAVPLSAIQAVVRSQLEVAAGGNVRAQCAILAMIRQVEFENVVDARFAARRAPVNDDNAVDHDDAADDDEIELAGRADEIDADVESQQEEGEHAAAPPSSADSASQPECAAASPPAAKARIRKGAVVRDTTSKRRDRRKRGRSARTTAARKAPPELAASPGLQGGGTTALRRSIA